jgi:hypothetical protein
MIRLATELLSCATSTGDQEVYTSNGSRRKLQMACLNPMIGLRFQSVCQQVRRVSGRSGRAGFLRRGERDQPGECARAGEREDDDDRGNGNSEATATVFA